MLQYADTTVRSYGVIFLDYCAMNLCYFLNPLHCCVFAKWSAYAKASEGLQEIVKCIAIGIISSRRYKTLSSSKSQCSIGSKIIAITYYTH